MVMEGDVRVVVKGEERGEVDMGETDMGAKSCE
jgi:hypothetical protein